MGKWLEEAKNEVWQRHFAKLDEVYGEDIGDLIYYLYVAMDADNDRQERLVNEDMRNILSLLRKKH